jgi:hypothetical protein
MSDPAATLALCAYLKKQIALWENAAKTELELVPGERKAALLGGVTVAYTNKVKGRRSVRVHNEQLLLAYVQETYPDEVEAVVQIRPAFRAKLLDDVQKGHKLVGADGIVWDCAEVVEGEPFLTTRLEPEAGVAIAGLLQKGLITVDGLKELES